MELERSLLDAWDRGAEATKQTFQDAIERQLDRLESGEVDEHDFVYMMKVLAGLEP